MQDLLQSLQDHDIGFIRAMAELWGLDPPAGPAAEAAKALTAQLLRPEVLEEALTSLPSRIQDVLGELVGAGGRLPWADLERRFGPLRSLGPGRRDREKPWQNPASPLESLWYRGLVARAFADTPVGFEEFGFIPNEFLAQLRASLDPGGPGFGHPVETPNVIQLSSSRIVDDAVTLMSALRRRPASDPDLPSERRQRLASFLLQPSSLELVLQLLQDLGIVAGRPLQPSPEQARAFLSLERSQALGALAQAWVASRQWNDLAHVPGLDHATLPWPNEPTGTRQAVLQMLRGLPRRAWWDLASFQEGVKAHRPGFQRPGGDFDAWYVQDARSGRFLRGFEHWDAVDGRLLAYVISGPLHWIGAVDLGADHPGEAPTAMRTTPWFDVLLDPKTRPTVESIEGSASISMDGKLKVPRSIDVSLRYQVARICTWIGLDKDIYTYQLTAQSLQSARQQDLTVAQIRALLARLTDEDLPPGLDQALGRFEARGADANLARKLLFTVTQTDALERLRRERKAARFLKHPVGDRTFLIDESDLQPLLRLSLRLGVWIQPSGASMDDSP
jgi:hypothetical protein